MMIIFICYRAAVRLIKIRIVDPNLGRIRIRNLRRPDPDTCSGKVGSGSIFRERIGSSFGSSLNQNPSKIFRSRFFVTKKYHIRKKIAPDPNVKNPKIIGSAMLKINERHCCDFIVISKLIGLMIMRILVK